MVNDVPCDSGKAEQGDMPGNEHECDRKDVKSLVEELHELLLSRCRDVPTNGTSIIEEVTLIPDFVLESNPEMKNKKFIEGPNIMGFSKKTFVELFLTARNILIRQSLTAYEVNAASLALLYTSYENYTNVKRRYRHTFKGISIVLQEGTDAETETVTRGFYIDNLSVDRVKLELNFIKPLLRSSLSKFNKSSVLWHYRRSLILALVLERPTSSVNDWNIYKSLLVQEFTSVVLPSAEKHYMNYYAWSYARWLVKIEQLLSPDSSTFAEFYQIVKEKVDNFSFKHLRDNSSWSFRLWLSLLDDEIDPCVLSPLHIITQCSTDSVMNGHLLYRSLIDRILIWKSKNRSCLGAESSRLSMQIEDLSSIIDYMSADWGSRTESLWIYLTESLKHLSCTGYKNDLAESLKQKAKQLIDSNANPDIMKLSSPTDATRLLRMLGLKSEETSSREEYYASKAWIILHEEKIVI